MIINANEKITITLAAGSVLTVAAPSGTTGFVTRLSRMPGGGDAQSLTAINGANLTFGAYADVERFNIECTAGAVTLTTAAYDPASDASDTELAAILATGISNGDLTHAPDGNAIYDALALKANLTAPPFVSVGLPEKTPVNAVAASKLLTIGTAPTEGATVSIGGVTYKFRADIGAGVAALGTLTFNSELPHDGDTVLLGATTFTFKTALSTEPAVANEILIEATVTATIDNLVAAVSGGAGEGTKYSTGTVSQGAVTVEKATADTFVVTYASVGFLGNQYDTAGTLTHATWGNTHLVGGIDAQAANDVLIGVSIEAAIDNLVLAITAGAGAGTNYGTGTVVNLLATAVKASIATMTATNKIKGVIGNSTVIAETLDDGSWASGATALSGGINGTVGITNEICADANYIYHCIGANTIADANWRRIARGSAY